MKKLLFLFCVLTLGLTVFAQEEKSSEPAIKDNNDVDFVILEMKLGAVLGGFKNGKFVNSAIASKGVKIDEEYTLFGLNVGKNEGILKLTKMHKSDLDFCPNYYAVDTTDKTQSGVALSSNARWNATPRIPKEIDSSNIVYKAIVKKFIESKGIKNPSVNIKKILKVDLEGDGVDEVLIQARHRSSNEGFETVKGEYSFVMLRKVVNGKVKHILLGGDFKKETREDEIPYEFELSSILDLNADGKMEIVTYGSYYEGAWVEAFQIKDGKSNKILETGCGV